MRSRLLALLLGIVALLGGFVAIGMPAFASSAQSIDDSGWWSKAKQGPLAGVVPAPPGTEPGQLAVQGAPDEAAAIAAIRATLPEGTSSPVLTLQVAANGDTGGDSAIILACQAGSAWNGGDALPWDARPSFDCTQSVQGQRAPDGTTWTFPIGPLQFTDQVNVILIPGRDPTLPDGAIGSSFSLVFEKPTAASITTTDGSSTGFDGAAGGFDVGPAAPSIGDTDSFTTPAVGSTGFSASPVQPALPASDQGLTATAPVVQARNPARIAQPVSSLRSGNARGFGFLVLLLGGAGSWWFAQQASPLPRKLGRFATVEGAAAGAAVAPALREPSVGGLGRFARTRTGAPPRL